MCWTSFDAYSLHIAAGQVTNGQGPQRFKLCDPPKLGSVCRSTEPGTQAEISTSIGPPKVTTTLEGRHTRANSVFTCPVTMAPTGLVLPLFQLPRPRLRPARPRPPLLLRPPAPPPRPPRPGPALDREAAFREHSPLKEGHPTSPQHGRGTQVPTGDSTDRRISNHPSCDGGCSPQVWCPTY